MRLDALLLSIQHLMDIPGSTLHAIMAPITFWGKQFMSLEKLALGVARGEIRDLQACAMQMKIKSIFKFFILQKLLF